MGAIFSSCSTPDHPIFAEEVYECTKNGVQTPVDGMTPVDVSTWVHSVMRQAENKYAKERRDVYAAYPHRASPESLVPPGRTSPMLFVAPTFCYRSGFHAYVVFGDDDHHHVGRVVVRNTVGDVIVSVFDGSRVYEMRVVARKWKKYEEVDEVIPRHLSIW